MDDHEDEHVSIHTFEISMEVANKVGGIYTVLRSKAPSTCEELGDDYTMVGIVNEHFVGLEVEEIDPVQPSLANTITSMRNKGVKVITGRWLIEGYPRVVLFDVDSVWHEYNSWAWDLFEKTGIGIPDHDVEAKRCVLFGYLTAWFLGEMRAQVGRKDMLIAHFHEWLTGVGLVLSRTRGLDVATIFTTHATLLGRYLCADSCDFYNNLQHFQVDVEAGKRQIYHRYCIERAATHSSHVFTTVSDITALEAEHLLKRKPDVITPNGLNVKNSQCLHEFQNLHAISKEKIHNFVRGHFYGHFDLDLDNTLYLFIAGRYEYKNKGADIFIEALSRLNHKLQVIGSKTTVVAFLIFPAPTNNFNVESLKGQAVVKQLKQTCDVIKDEIGERIFDFCIRGKLPSNDLLLTRDDLVKLKRCMYANKCQKLPPIVTHNMKKDGDDPILQQIRRVNLFNSKHDRVKVIFHPEFLHETSPLLPIDYQEFVRGCHLGVFPSYYEPWGYTPAECMIKGIPSITTNLSGFGCFMERHLQDAQAYGVYVVDRRHQGADDSCNQLTDFMYSFTRMTRRERIIQRNRTERLSELLDWTRLSRYYGNSRRLAIERTHPELLESGPGSSASSVRLPRPYSARNSPFNSRNASPFPSDTEDFDAKDSGYDAKSSDVKSTSEGTVEDDVRTDDAVGDVTDSIKKDLVVTS